MSDTPQTRFTQVSDESGGRTRRVITQIDGPLADRVRAHYAKTGDVTVTENGVEYSFFGVPVWTWSFEVRVGDERVWARSDVDADHEEGLLTIVGLISMQVSSDSGSKDRHIR